MWYGSRWERALPLNTRNLMRAWRVLVTMRSGIPSVDNLWLGAGAFRYS